MKKILVCFVLLSAFILVGCGSVPEGGEAAALRIEQIADIGFGPLEAESIVVAEYGQEAFDWAINNVDVNWYDVAYQLMHIIHEHHVDASVWYYGIFNDITLGQANDFGFETSHFEHALAAFGQWYKVNGPVAPAGAETLILIYTSVFEELPLAGLGFLESQLLTETTAVRNYVLRYFDETINWEDHAYNAVLQTYNEVGWNWNVLNAEDIFRTTSIEALVNTLGHTRADATAAVERFLARHIH